MAEQGKEISTDVRFSDDELRAVDSFESAIALLRANGAELTSTDQFGSGFDVLGKDEKGQLVGIPFVIIEWRINERDGSLFASFTLVTKDGRKFIVNDGGTGIMEQLTSWNNGETKGKGVIVPRGLRESKYFFIPEPTAKNPKPEKIPAVTYYLSTDKAR